MLREERILVDALALRQALLELLAFGGQVVDERRAEAVEGLVALDHDAVGFLEALREGLAWKKKYGKSQLWRSNGFAQCIDMEGDRLPAREMEGKGWEWGLSYGFLCRNSALRVKFSSL